MTRIIAGAAGGRRLAVPDGQGTRPTSDRAREALFSSLESTLVGGLVGRRFLDLYAGSGAVGLEALSRGASHATLVESDAKALRTLRQNVTALGLAAEVVGMTVERAVAAPARAPFDVAFADPPYSLPPAELAAVLADLLAGDWLTPDGVVVVERPSRERDWVWPTGLEELRHRAYGEAVLRYARRS